MELAKKTVSDTVERISNAKDEFEMISAIFNLRDQVDVLNYARDVLIREAMRDGYTYRRVAQLANITPFMVERAIHREQFLKRYGSDYRNELIKRRLEREQQEKEDD